MQMMLPYHRNYAILTIKPSITQALHYGLDPSYEILSAFFRIAAFLGHAAFCV